MNFLDASFTFLSRIEEIEMNIKDKRWQSALALSLTIPDICGVLRILIWLNDIVMDVLSMIKSPSISSLSSTDTKSGIICSYLVAFWSLGRI